MEGTGPEAELLYCTVQCCGWSGNRNVFYLSQQRITLYVASVKQTQYGAIRDFLYCVGAVRGEE